jgi:serine/threonine protein kinase
MTPDRWQRAKDLFAEACEREPDERDSFLRNACAGDDDLLHDVSSLLRAYDQSDKLFATLPCSPADAMTAPMQAPGAAFAAAPARVDPLLGETIGSYKIIRQIGRGGMGAVYIAERADEEFRRLVAVKVMNPDLVDSETLRRFHNERQMLAALDHPNIVKLLDSGTTRSGTPYLVMDYVEGQRIDAYCESRNPETWELLQLFRKVCSAVHYAHQNLVVHRDLKPANIVITSEGEPKLLDFGIAKLLKPEYANDAGLTRTEARPMTPEYASPEQILGQPITTSTDVYSLGVLLFRLLTGYHPYSSSKQSALQLQRAICETDPEKPSTFIRHHTTEGERRSNGHGRTGQALARALKGDLDMIVLMAMRKEPQRRYASVEHFSEDIRRYLEGRPVIARRHSWRYRVQKFVARNKAAVVLACLVAIVLIASTIVALKEKAIAQRRFLELRQFAKFTINDLDDAMKSGVTPARQKLVSQGLEYLDGLTREARNDISIQKDLISGYIKMGDVQGNLYSANLGESRGAEQSYQKALAIAEALIRSHPEDSEARRDIANANLKLGDLLALGGERKGALDRYARAKDLYSQLRVERPNDPERLLDLMRIWDRIGSTLGQFDPYGALDSYRHAVEVGQAWFALDPKARNRLAFARERVAYFTATTGNPSGAEDVIQEALRTYQASATSEPTVGASRNIAKVYKTMAEVQKRNGKPAEALDNVRRSLQITEALLEKDRKNRQYQIDLQQGLVLLIDLLIARGDNGEARRQTERALEFLRPLAEAGDASVYQIEDYVWLLVTTPFKDLEDNAAALRLARKATVSTNESDPVALDLLARATAKAGSYGDAVAIEQKAAALLPPKDSIHGPSELGRMIDSNLSDFQAGLARAAAHQTSR